MKPRTKRAVAIVGGLAALGVAAALVLNAFQSNLVFFFTPTQVAKKEVPLDRNFRVGGLVEGGTVVRHKDALNVSFKITDGAESVPVTYTGILPDLFKEGKGVVAEGRVGTDGVFKASQVLAKHDENYMPPEAAYALEQGKAARQSGPSDPTPAELVQQGARP